MKIGIIGAGIAGLSAAYELVKKGHEVSVFEQAPIPGGLGDYIPIGNTFLERYYHHFFQSDKYIHRYASELGIADKLKFYDAKTSILINNAIFPFNSPKDLLTYSPLSFLDKIRCGITTGFLKFFPIPLKTLDHVSASDWVKKYAGNVVFQNLWGPLLKGKFSEFADKLPALWLWGRVYDRSFKLGYFDGSIKILFDALVKRIIALNGELYFRTKIIGIETKRNKVYIYIKNKKIEFDKVIVTAVSPEFEHLIKNKLPKKYRNFLDSIDHLGAVCVVLELRKPIQSQYWINICESNAPVLVMIEHTNLIPADVYGGRHIVYLANYLHRNNPRFQESDKKILDSYSSILKKINERYEKSWIIRSHIFRNPKTQTIFPLGSLERIPSIQTELDNIYLINIDQMYPHDRNINQGIQLGKKVASLM